MKIATYYVGDPAAPKPNRPAHLGVNALVICQQRLLLERRWDCDQWGLPGGGVRRTETLKGAMVRELHEETGLRVSPAALLPLKFYDTPSRIAAYRDGSVWRMYVKLFVLRLQEMPTLRISHESRRLQFFSAQELKELAIVATHRDMVLEHLELLDEPSEDAALAFLQKQPLLHMDMLEPIRRNEAELLFAGAHGVLLRHTPSGTPMLSTDSPRLAALLLPMLQGAKALVVHQEFERDLAKKLLHFSGETPCYQAVYPAAPLPVWGDIRVLDESDLEQVYKHYFLAHSKATLARLLRDGQVYGQYLDGKLSAFIGSHPEGAIGLLHVMDAYRRRGIGQNLLHFMINLWHQRGAEAFAQIVFDNERSLALQRKCHAALSDTLLYWLWRD